MWLGALVTGSTQTNKLEMEVTILIENESFNLLRGRRDRANQHSLPFGTVYSNL